MQKYKPVDIDSHKTEHGLLIELRTEMRAMRGDINDIKGNTTSRITLLERDVASLKTARAIWYAYGVLVTLVLVPIAAAYVSSGRF